VLMVGAFEAFLKAFCPEALTPLSDARTIDFALLPSEMQETSVFGTLDTAMTTRVAPNDRKFDRLPSITKAANFVASGSLNPAVFGDTQSNPGKKTVERIGKTLGFSNIFAASRTRFESTWGSAVSGTFIEDTLEAIVNRRHGVAHTASALNISRLDLQVADRFLTVFATTLDIVVRQHISQSKSRARFRS